MAAGWPVLTGGVVAGMPVLTPAGMPVLTEDGTPELAVEGIPGLTEEGMPEVLADEGMPDP
jgi:hypothetical protein